MVLTIERRNLHGVKIPFPVYHSIEELVKNPPIAEGLWVRFHNPAFHSQKGYGVIVDIEGLPYIVSYEEVGGKMHLQSLARDIHPWR
ncbi:hypothetical protein HYU13_02475 [Candidatus Woesearchaeota archaeon]|nr:hypothetical protein [Candidatus Woesearchaeota archaeon]